MTDDPLKPKMLPEVTITAKRVDPKKYRTAKEKVKLYPDEEVDKRSVDSLMKAGRGSVIGQPLKRPGMMDMYSPEQGDVIKKLMKNGSKTL